MFDFSIPDNGWSLLQAILVVGGFGLVWRQICIASEQNSISHLNHFRKTWNAEPMLSARLQVCEDYPKTEYHLTAHDDLVAAFLEDLAAAVHVSQTNREHAWSYFSYYVHVYWPILEHTLEQYQSEVDQTYFSGFKKLRDNFNEIDSAKGAPVPSAEVLRRLIEEEKNVLKFRISNP